MSKFYARYVPPAKKATTPTEPEAHLNGSTKRKLPEQDLALREPKKPRSAEEEELKKDGFGVKRFVPKDKNSVNVHMGKSRSETASPPPQPERAKSRGREVLDKYTVTGAAKKHDAETEVRLRKPVEKITFIKDEQAAPELPKEPKAKKTKKKRRDKPDGKKQESEPIHNIIDVGDNSSEDGFEIHTAVRDRFNKAKKKSEQRQDDQPSDDTQDTPKPELHGLEPLPQPPEVEQPYEPPSYSTLLPWLAKAEHVSQDLEVSFASLGISRTILANLKTKGFENAMPIQSAVVPLLSKGPTKYNGDLAVAAATGSGKTLAYVLPVVEALDKLAVTKLRGVIVVPTRELVKQVQETFNMCAEGTNLRSATALGSKSVKEEVDALVERYDVYDAEAYDEQQSKKVDWAEFSLSELFDRVKDGTKQALNHVTKYRSKVDVLICTPGRLVEHLQTTQGFTLDDVQWLVIDEVDRLLNESYQEWLEIVMPALKSRGATEVRDKVLQDMGMDLPPRLITKVILSATMTQDISKLNSLELRNPRLLTLDGDQLERFQNTAKGPGEAANPHPDGTGAFQLPGTLTETAVLVGDGSDKPLHLLELLRTSISEPGNSVVNGITAHDTDASSSDSSDDMSSSASDADSDSSTHVQFNGVKHSPPTSTKYPSTLIFTRSTSAAPRLSRLLHLLSPNLASQIAVLTRSTTSSSSSRRALKYFRTGVISILITTDRAARGLDIPNIEHVINYDVPSSVEFYVHRVGRTARAGKTGKAWTLLAHREGRWFDQEVMKGEQVRRSGKVSKITLESVGKDKDVKKRYDDALTQLGEEVEGK